MSLKSVKILAFSGSQRHGSYNGALLRAAVELAPPDVEIEICSLADLPIYNGDVEAAGMPQPVQRFKERIRASDALLIATPEYNFSMPGLLKNALDWASRPPARTAAAQPAAPTWPTHRRSPPSPAEPPTTT